MADVQPSVLKIRGKAPSCQRQLEGTGFVIGPELVMTNAHVVAGTPHTVEVIGRRGHHGEPRHGGLYDPEVDVAVLRVPDLDASRWSSRRSRPPATTRSCSATRSTATSPSPRPGSAQEIKLKGPDIYDATRSCRDVYTVRAMVRSGNSGGPMMDPTGRVIGVVFGAALDDPETGFVLTVEPGAGRRSRPRPSRTAAVATGTCAGLRGQRGWHRFRSRRRG